MARRVFLLGLDGASWNVLDRMFAAGVMPHLERLCREGVRATLESTIPPITPIAWTSLMTGVNPGKHGVYGFMKKAKGNTYLATPVNRMDIQAPTIFDYYRDEKRLISLNLPMSYPATPFAGVMVTCMMTPLRNMGDFEHPRGLLKRFAAAGIDYTIDPKFKVRADASGTEMFLGWQSATGEFVDMLIDITRNRMRAVRLLMDEELWDVFVCVIVGTDRLQHVHWDRVVPPGGDAPDPEICRYYREVDDQIGELAGRLTSDDTLLLASDHGFVRHHGDFMVNEWLRHNGWLYQRQAARSPLYPLKRIADRVGLTRQKLGRVIGEKGASRLQLASAHIDWARSMAYLHAPFGIRVNLKGRETLGGVAPRDFAAVRDEIIARLRDLRGDDGEPVLSRVDDARELYRGDSLEEAPDIVFTFRDDRNCGAYLGGIGTDLFVPAPAKTGDHRIDGVFVAWGGGIRHIEGEQRFRIWDVLPTLMHLNGRPVPAICDGRVLQEILSDESPVRTDAEWQRYLPERFKVAYDRAQEDEIKERLRDLGYMSDD